MKTLILSILVLGSAAQAANLTDAQDQEYTTAIEKQFNDRVGKPSKHEYELDLFEKCEALKNSYSFKVVIPPCVALGLDEYDGAK